METELYLNLVQIVEGNLGLFFSDLVKPHLNVQLLFTACIFALRGLDILRICFKEVRKTCPKTQWQWAKQLRFAYSSLKNFLSDGLKLLKMSWGGTEQA